MNNKLADYVSFEDLSDDMKLVAQSCGLEVARALLCNCPGIQLYVPRPENMTEVMRRYVRSRIGERPPTDAEIKAIAVELGRSPSYLRQIMSRTRPEH